VRAHVPDGSSVALGLMLESSIPFAFGHELIRQRVRRLTAVRADADADRVRPPRESAEGLAHAWGNLGVAEAALAAKAVIVCAEEVLPRAELLAEPNRVLVPLHKVVAVVEVPGGAHPSPVPGHHDRDHGAFARYHEASRTLDGFAGWVEEWVLAVPDRATYLAKL
jgi:glutaconate CoA-transferase subunit A